MDIETFLRERGLKKSYFAALIGVHPGSVVVSVMPQTPQGNTTDPLSETYAYLPMCCQHMPG